MYRMLMADMAENTFNIKEKLEMELNVVIEDGTWEDMSMIKAHA